MDEIVIYSSRWKLFLALLGSVGFVLLGCFLIVQQDDVGLFMVLIGVVAILFFGGTGAYVGLRLIHPTPVLRINKDGIFDNATLSSVGLVKWEEVGKVFVYEFMGVKMLGIIPTNWPDLLDHLPRYKQILVNMNSSLVEAPINIPQSVLPMTVEELMAEILDYHSSLSDGSIKH